MGILTDAKLMFFNSKTISYLQMIERIKSNNCTDTQRAISVTFRNFQGHLYADERAVGTFGFSQIW